METVFNEAVSSLPAGTKQSLEAMLGRSLEANQRVLISVSDSAADTVEELRQAARDEFHELCHEGTANRERLGVSIDQADQILDEAVRAARSRKAD